MSQSTLTCLLARDDDVFAGMVAQAEKEGREIPVMQSAPDPSLVPCPNCGRTFNAKAAERHIPKCADINGRR